MKQERAVYAAAESEHAIVVSALALTLDLFCKSGELLSAQWPLKPVRRELTLVLSAVVTHPFSVELNPRIGCVHHTSRAQLIASAHRWNSESSALGSG